MVATKLSEVVSKGFEWAYGSNTSGTTTPGATPASSPTKNNNNTTTTTTSWNESDLKTPQSSSQPPPSTQQPPPPSSASSSSWYWSSPTPDENSSYWNYASDSINKATEPIYSNLEDVVKYFYPDSSTITPFPMSSSLESQEDAHFLAQQQRQLQQQRQPQQQKRRFGSLAKYSEFTWMLKNPNLDVRGRGGNPSALPAVRSLLSTVDQLKRCSGPPPTIPEDDEYDDPTDAILSDSDTAPPPPTMPEEPSFPKLPEQSLPSHQQRQQSTSSVPEEFDMYESWTGTTTAADEGRSNPKKKPVSNSETASLLAEGTLRSLRDFALDEAVQLNAALQYWALRWETPWLSWLEAGPRVWLSKEGYKHQEVGQKVSQIQAVLARRCSAIGQLQQHLLRAGWQRGVAQWGVLGQGGRWAAVAAIDGAPPSSASSDGEMQTPRYSMVGHHTPRSTSNKNTSNSNNVTNNVHISHHNRKMPHRVSSEISETSQSMMAKDENMDQDETEMMEPAAAVTKSNSNTNFPSQAPDFPYYGHGNIFVRNTHGGKIVTDDPAWADWSVDAVRLIRIHLDRAANGLVRLPFADNWRRDEDCNVQGGGNDAGQLISPAPVEPAPCIPNSRPLPRWARILPSEQSILATTDGEDEMEQEHDEHDGEKILPPPPPPLTPPKIYISDLKLLANEISELLTAMEFIMAMQRSRRLDKLKPMGWLRRNWYFAAGMAPVVAYFTKTLVNNNYGKELAVFLLDKLAGFFREHVTGPLMAIWEQLFRGRATISDRKALEVANETLKAMILTWLTENHREMPEAERKAKAQAMDVTWIDKTKEESMKSVLEGVNVVRMSFIQMQFIYKEVLNALVAMDDIIESNWINMNLAAVTPAILALYGVQWVSRLLYYVLLKLGTTREETFASFRQVILDIERLLVMRDNPPFAPPPLQWGDGDDNYHQQPELQTVRRCDTLSADDLGMLMLHIHECRTILWKDRRRFSSATIRNVAEDLAELAGERGAVSVQQQILIVSRMCRTYPFLKVLSAGTPFQLSAVHTHAV